MAKEDEYEVSLEEMKAPAIDDKRSPVSLRVDNEDIETFRDYGYNLTHSIRLFIKKKAAQMRLMPKPEQVPSEQQSVDAPAHNDSKKKKK